MKHCLMIKDFPVLLDTLSHVESVTLGVWVGVGARYETPEINGISHMLEHMAFKGTKVRTAQQIAEEIESVGGDINAYTSMEVTAYHIRVLKEHIPLAIDILADILQNSTFEPEEFKKEQCVILQEIGQSQDTPDDIVFDYFQKTCFPDQPLGRPILGTEETVKSLTPQRIQSYLKEKHTSQKMVFAAAGNFSTEEVEHLITKHFNNIHSFDLSSSSKACYVGGDYRCEKDLEQVHLVMGFEGVSYLDPFYYDSLILSVILGGGMSSRLFQEIREKRGLVYSIYSFTQSYADAGVFGIYAGTGEKEVEELLPTACLEIKKLCSTLKEEEINRAKAQVRSSLVMSLESTAARCKKMAMQMLQYGRIIPLEETLEKIESVNLTRLITLAERLFLTTPTLVSLGPIRNVISYEDHKKLL